jgi:hypothetical protein
VFTGAARATHAAHDPHPALGTRHLPRGFSSVQAAYFPCGSRLVKLRGRAGAPQRDKVLVLVPRAEVQVRHGGRHAKVHLTRRHAAVSAIPMPPGLSGERAWQAAAGRTCQPPGNRGTRQPCMAASAGLARALRSQSRHGLNHRACDQGPPVHGQGAGRSRSGGC